MKKWFPFVLSVLCLLSVRFSLAQEPFFHRVVEIRINGSGACVLPDGSFVLCGNDGTVSDDRPAKAVCVNPYGDIVWEVTDKYAESAANDFLSLAALPSGDIMLSTAAHLIKDDTVITKQAITQLKNGRVAARYEQAEALGGAMIPMGEGFLCPTIDVSGACQSTHLTLYNAQCMPVRSFSSPKKFTIAALLPMRQNHLLVGSVITEDVNNRTTNGYLAEMDASGHLLWSTQSRIPGVSFSDAFLTQDDCVMVVGGYDTGQPMYGPEPSDIPTLSKYTAGGELLWHKEYAQDSTRFVSVVPCDQGLIAAGLCHADDNNHIVLCKFDLDGNRIKSWNPAPDLERPTTVLLYQTPYGIYYVASARETSVNAEGARERRYITCIGKVEAE